MRRRRYIHERPEWPAFRWDGAAIAGQLAAVRYRQGRLLGRMEALGFQLQSETTLLTLTQDALKTSEIEGELLTFPKIGDVAVFGIPHEDWGEEIKAVVQPAEGIAADDALRDEIFAFCQDRLAKFKRPKTIDFVAELPRDPSGKLYKRKLRDPYWANRDRSI